MDKQAWSRPAIVAALALAAAMPLTMDAQAFYGHGIGAGYQFATGSGEGSTVDKADPTDDGSIIIECVGFDSGTIRFAIDAGNAARGEHAATFARAVEVLDRGIEGGFHG